MCLLSPWSQAIPPFSFARSSRTKSGRIQASSPQAKPGLTERFPRTVRSETAGAGVGPAERPRGPALSGPCALAVRALTAQVPVSPPLIVTPLAARRFARRILGLDVPHHDV